MQYQTVVHNLKSVYIHNKQTNARHENTYQQPQHRK